MGYYAAKGNEKMKKIMERYKYENFFMKPDQVKEIDDAKAKAKQGASGTAPAPAPSPAPSPAPALRP